MIVRELIKEKGFTIAAVAEKMGINRTSLHQILQRGTYSTTTLQRIAEVIGCKLGDFFTDEMTEHKTECTCPHCGKEIKLNVTLS